MGDGWDAIFQNKKELINNLPSILPELYEPENSSRMANLEILERMKNKIHFTLGNHYLKKLVNMKDKKFRRIRFPIIIVWKRGRLQNNLKLIW